MRKLLSVDYNDHRPIYEQIKEKIKDLIISGALRENDKIPSVRELASELGINPNTIQKSYKDLENDGYINSVVGKGYFVSSVKNVTENGKAEQLLTVLSKTVSELYYLGVDYNVVRDILRKIYNEKEGISNDKG